MNLMNSINRTRIPSPVIVTLTYPDNWPQTAEERRKHLERFKSRLVRRYGKFPVIWRLEHQQRGAPHYHLLCFTEIDLKDLRSFVSESWYEAVGSGDERHLVAGTRCERARSWRGITSYIAKRLDQTESPRKHWKPPGRFWGCWYRDLLPVDTVEIEIPTKVAYKIRRQLARYAGIPLKRFASSHTFKVYMPDHCVRRLLTYYGCPITSRGSPLDVSGQRIQPAN